jgi:hypothetical protein
MVPDIEASELGMSPPIHLRMGQEDMTKAWRIWVRQSRFTLKGADARVAKPEI